MKIFGSISEQLEKLGHKKGSPNQVLTVKPVIAKAKVNRLRQAHPPLMLGITIVSLTSVIGYRFYSQPELDVDTISPVQIVAPRDGTFEDTKTTELERKKAQKAVIPILKQDKEITEKIQNKLITLFQEIEELRSIFIHDNFVDSNLIKFETQQYLLSFSEQEWQTILLAINNKKPILETQANLREIVKELEVYRQKVSQDKFNLLLNNINNIRKKNTLALQRLLLLDTSELKSLEKLNLLKINEENWLQTKDSILQASRRILTQGIPKGLPSNMLEETVKMQLSLTIPSETISIGTKILMGVLEPNLIEDKEATAQRAEKAASSVSPVLVSIKQGEVIVEAGEKISQEDFVLLDAFKLSRRSINVAGLIISLGLVTSATVIFCWVKSKIHRQMRGRDHLLLCLLTLSTPILIKFDVSYSNLPTVGILVSSFYNPSLAVTQVSLLTGLVLFAQEGSGWEYILPSAIGGLIAAFMAGKLRTREEMALLGVGIGLAQGVSHLMMNLIVSSAAGTIWYVVLPGAIIYGLSGVAWSVVALGISPYLEKFFDLITPIRLAELSNPNRPLLKRLAIEAPGTFQHTMFVASLAEAAARELGCNVELIRAGTLYHDIGKLHDPLGFIENQMGKPNKHDQLNDPWQSAEIIKKHVSEGLVLARRYNLPKAIADFIPQHQGTLLISYFYFQAKHTAEQEGSELIEDHFRYDGPIPQSREAGIMMLADGCEAALRSLKDATPEMALCTVHKIFKARWQENQLAESGLKYEELKTIAEIFVKVWQECNHQRIAYPKCALEPQNKECNNKSN